MMAAPGVTIRSMTIEDHPALLVLWRQSAGMKLGPSDSRDAIDAFLRRNPGLSAVALTGLVVGAVLCGHDGRRGYLHHVAVAVPFQRQKIGTRLVEW